MYIKAMEYDIIAYTIVSKFLKSYKHLKSTGLTPAPFNEDEAIHQWLPDKYLDENTDSINYWTKHNERKLRKYIKLEVTRRKARIS